MRSKYSTSEQFKMKVTADRFIMFLIKIKIKSAMKINIYDVDNFLERFIGSRLFV